MKNPLNSTDIAILKFCSFIKIPPVIQPLFERRKNSSKGYGLGGGGEDGSGVRELICKKARVKQRRNKNLILSIKDIKKQFFILTNINKGFSF